ncbi:hypothetical protein GIB67_015763 [Kingdonia uniflora]|uniref:TF-B3 domain-containing protein n=1 Tax=Kingdonia uniflora TaxID=39325 RepID=A0A7J7NUF1_9MAGN|nr:hypothetical protein GIB67_015763 [Kingdonia uniflora]
MFPSNISGSFWLALPSKFYASHLPKNDIMITLVDVKDDEYTVKYIVKVLAVSNGWRIFTIANKLTEGGALVFQLVEDVKFKVYIIRIDGSSGDNEDSGLCSLNVKANQKDLLHKNLPQGDHELVDGIILETVMIADHIKACNLSTTSDEFEAWKKCLKGFKHLEMVVRFLHIKLKRLKKLVCGSEHDSKERKEVLAQQARMSGEIKTLEAKLFDLKTPLKILKIEEAAKPLGFKVQKQNYKIQDIEESISYSDKGSTYSLFAFETQEKQSQCSPTIMNHCSTDVTDNESGDVMRNIPGHLSDDLTMNNIRGKCDESEDDSSVDVKSDVDMKECVQHEDDHNIESSCRENSKLDINEKHFESKAVHFMARLH